MITNLLKSVSSRLLLSNLVLLFVLVLICPGRSIAQDRSDPFTTFIAALDSNNTSLQALRQVLIAQKAGNRVGLNPADPEVGISYLRPNPRLSDRRLDFEISQELEFPTVYGHRRKVADQLDESLDWQYRLERNEVLSQALQIWVDWQYYHRNREVLELQMVHATQISQAFQRAFEAGEINILDRNKSKIHALNASKSFELNEIELQSALHELTSMNGGRPIGTLPVFWPNWELPEHFEDWQAYTESQSVLLQTMQQDLSTQQAQEKLARSMLLPNLHVGFMREQDIEVDFRGVTFGMSIPLWQHRNRSKQARLQTRAQESLLYHTSNQQELEQRRLFLKAKTLKTQTDELKTIVRENSSPELLRKALDMGEITLVEYLVELSMYYELMEKALQAEREYLSVQVQLRKWLL